MSGTNFFPDATSALQTIVAVSVLIALVLVARRPVAKHFGAGVAYALWALPLARLVLWRKARLQAACLHPTP